MTVVSRRFAACPARTASETWDAIIKVIASDSERIRTELWSIVGVVASIISDEIPSKSAITMLGNGPRLRIYCLYDDDAIGDDASEGSLSWKPFENDWKIYFPVAERDLEWVGNILKGTNERFKTYIAGEDIGDDDKDANSQKTDFTQLTINTNKL